MRFCLLFFFIIPILQVSAQHQVSGRVINSENGVPLPYASINTSEDHLVLTNIDGSFSLDFSESPVQVKVSYVGYKPKEFRLTKGTEYVLIRLDPATQSLDPVLISDQENKAKEIIKKAISFKKQNNPEEVLKGYTYKNYTKFIIDNSGEPIKVRTDSTGAVFESIVNNGRAYLSEKVSRVDFNIKQGKKETVTGISTAGFDEPVYEVLSLDINPISLYEKDYKLFKTAYAAPLAKNALKNYSFRILDTIEAERPAYMIYFRPKRENVVAGLEGILYLDTQSYAIQKAKAQLLGAIKLEVEHQYKYFPEEKIWFPVSQKTTIRPGAGGKDISVFGGVISLGRVQRKNNILNRVISPKGPRPDLYLTSTSTNYQIELNKEARFKKASSETEVLPEALERNVTFWKNNRQEEFTSRDKATAVYVDSIIKTRNIGRQIEIKKSLATGHYPIGFLDFDLSKVFKFNNYEGIRLGLGGRTNNKLSEHFSLGGYAVYGFKDEQLKYNLNTELFLNKARETSLKIGYTNDIQEVGSFNYLTGVNDFALLEPRFVNISFFYHFKEAYAGITHLLTSKLKAEFQLGRSNISQLSNYSFNLNGTNYTDYGITEARLSFLWRPFSEFLRTPEATVMTEKSFPKFTGQINQGLRNVLGGDFNYTKLGLKAEHEIKRLDQSRTEFIAEGNYTFGDIPLTHLFHSYPNNPNRDEILRRFSVAGRNSFETMYFNEFFNDKLAMFHVRHQLRPFRIAPGFNPELVFISRYAIGSIENKERHQSLEFKSLKHGYAESGIEFNKIVAGLGLSAAYRYGAYHLPTFKENFSFKFTFQLQL